MPTRRKPHVPNVATPKGTNANRVHLPLCLLVVGIGMHLCATFTSSAHAQSNRKALHAQAVAESLVPIRPGAPGKAPFWNAHARRFIYVPAFDFDEVDGAKAYRFTAVTKHGTQTFEAGHPWAPLTPIWNHLPPGRVDLTVQALDRPGGRVIGTSGKRTFYRSAVFRGPYHDPPPVDYAEAARQGLRGLFRQPHVQHCLTKDAQPDVAQYKLYRYPSKVIGGMIRGLVLYSKLATDPRESADSLRIARHLADFLIGLSQPSGTPLEHFPPTYWKVNWRASHVREGNLMMNSPADAAFGYLDLYDATGERKYLDAATRIADTYRRLQRPDGTWPLLVKLDTGKPVSPNPLVPTWVITLMDRLAGQYELTQYRPVSQKAFQWIIDGPMRRFNWDGQFEDIKPQQPYSNLAREQACDVAVYLLDRADQHQSYLARAEELLRFAEDQFVAWEAPDEDQWALDDTRPTKRRQYVARWATSEWFAPCVLEQYSCYAPVARSSAIQINAYLKAYQVTGKPLYLAKARSLAGALIVAQEHHNAGEFPTWLVKESGLSQWSNNSAYAAMAVHNLAQFLKASGE